jgi:SPP1 family phage portal protein
MALNLTSAELDNLKNNIDLAEIAKNEAYYRGKNPPILEEKNKKKPDNKIPVALGYRLISNLSGFAARTGDIFINQVSEAKEDTDQSDFEKKRQELDKKNNGLLLNSQLYVDTLKQGISYDLVWTEKKEGSEVFDIKYAQIPNYQAVPIWDNELSTVKKLSGFIRFWEEVEMVGSDAKGVESSIPINQASESASKQVTIQKAQVFSVGGYQMYRKIGQADWMLDGEFVVQPFKVVQVSAYRGSKDAMPYIEPVTVLIDQMDKVISRNMNEVERFNNAILGVLKKISPEVKKKIDEMGVIDNLISGIEGNPTEAVFPKFIARDVPTAHAQMMLDVIEKLVYEIMGSPNFSDESFGTASGIALLYRLIGLEYSASETDVWYDQGLMNRNDLINQALSIQENVNEINEGFQPVIVHNRNLPVDVSFIADNALKLKAIGISDETILKLFPKSIIPDVKKEMERIEASKPDIDLDDIEESEENE